MNFLGHLFVADGLPETLQVGNFIADSIKGDPLKTLPVAVANGVRLHRAIDHFTDNHPAVEQVVALLYPNLGRVAPVVTDVLFDHILSRDFLAWHTADIQIFAKNKYALLTQYQNYFPLRVAQFFPHMTQHDWLTNYGHTEGFARALHGISQRLSFKPDLGPAIGHYAQNAAEIDDLFNAFLPEIVAFARATAVGYDV